MNDPDAKIQVVVQGTSPDELVAEAVRHADSFFGVLPPKAYEVELGVIEPAIWGDGGKVVRWQADAEVRPRPPKASGDRCTCGCGEHS